MKKILCVFDGGHFSEGLINFAAWLNEQQQILLTGIFLPSVDFSEASIYYLGGMAGVPYIPEIYTDPAVIDENIKKFEAVCQKNGIEYRIHRITDLHVIQELSKESRYADAMLISGELFYSNLGSGTQKEYVGTTVHKAECPVIMVPEAFNIPESVIIAYDGSEASVFALKQFCYLFPVLTALKTLIVYVKPEGSDLPDIEYIEELAARHFADLTFLKLEIDPQRYFATWMMDKGNAFLVSGSFGRSFFSELFKKNFVQDVIADHKLPVFIAHP